LARILGRDATSISAAAAIIRKGGLVAFPTDTVYGLGCDPWSGEAVDRLFESKGRETKPIPVLCAGVAEAEGVVVLDDVARGLAGRFWPGALTIVAPLKRVVPPKLDQGTGWLGVRVPDSEIARSLALELGGWVTGTSANLSGQPSCRTAEEVDRCMGDRIEAVIDGGRTGGTESTIVKVVGGSVEVLRRGAIGIDSGIKRESFNR
jgi:L-threonylcarbamoyladenylate synthase